MPARQLTRRGFVKGSAAAVGLTVLAAKSYAQVSGANNRLNVGIIGCGGMAGHHLGRLLAMRESENLAITMVCDVYRTRAEQFCDRVKEAGADAPLVTQDHRAVLERKDVDYVLIASPEHSHARLTLDALDAGKHVYCEKPLTHTIPEAKKVVKKVRETGLKLQVGVQSMADDSYSSAHEAIKAGMLGPVVHAQIDYVRRYSEDQGPWRRGTSPDQAQPADLDWREWLRPARRRPWDPRRYFEWRNYEDYSGGVATDLFVHRITRLIKACGLACPSRAVGMGGIILWPDGRELPDNFEMTLEYPAVEGVTPGMVVNVLGTMANQTGNRHCIRGHKGTLFFTPEGWEIKAEGSGEVVQKHQKTGGEDVVPHHRNHHAAIRDGAELYCPAELGYYAQVAVRMANLSWFKRKMLAWNPRRETVVSA